MKRKLIFYLIFSLAFCSMPIMGQNASDVLRSQLKSMSLNEYDYEFVDIYSNGKDKFERLFADISSARRSVDVEYFIYAGDSIANAMTRLLEDKARQGVKVRLVIDSYKDVSRHYGRTQQWCDSIREAHLLPGREGADGQSYFEPRLFDPWRFPYINHVPRDHRKIVVIDDSIGYIGGLNVADYYLNGKSEFGGWRDTHIRVTGAATDGLSLYFEDAWYRCGGHPRELQPRVLSCDQRGEMANARLASKAHSVIYFERSRDSHQKKAETRRAIVAALQSARDSLHIVSPYFLPTHSVRKALIDAIDRGVKVDIMFSKVGDEPILSVGNYDFARRLTRHGATVHLYKGAFHHSKIIMIDGEVSMVGSANMNSRSLRWDYEASAFVFSTEVTHRLDSIFFDDLRNCDIFTSSDYRREKPFSTRLYGWFVNRFLTPFL